MRVDAGLRKRPSEEADEPWVAFDDAFADQVRQIVDARGKHDLITETLLGAYEERSPQNFVAAPLR